MRFYYSYCGCPEIYAEIVATRPEQVKAIYIRDVSQSAQRTDVIRQIIKNMEKHGVEMLLVSDTAAATAHALKQGYIGQGR